MRHYYQQINHKFDLQKFAVDQSSNLIWQRIDQIVSYIPKKESQRSVEQCAFRNKEICGLQIDYLLESATISARQRCQPIVLQIDVLQGTDTEQ